MIKNWSKYLSSYHYVSSPILSRFLWLKLSIRVFLFLALRVKTSVLSTRFFMKPEYNREGKFKYLWIQLTYTLPKLWRDRILNYRGNLMYACIFDHHVIKKNDTAWKSWELENYVKYKFLRSTRNQLYSYNMKDISTTQILNGSQYNYYLVW